MSTIYGLTATLLAYPDQPIVIVNICAFYTSLKIEINTVLTNVNFAQSKDFFSKRGLFEQSPAVLMTQVLLN